METELFTVYIKGDSMRFEINETVLKAYGRTLEEFEAKFNSDNLIKCTMDVLDSII